MVMIRVLMDPLVIAAISTAFAIIITIVDSIVNNYGDVEIDINNGKKVLKVKGGSPLLQTLASQGIFVASACGGRGTCGACKVKVLSDVGPYLPTEMPHMSSEDISKNVRLACQVKVKSGIKIELPEELFNIKKYKGVVESLKNVTYDIKELRIKLIEPNEISFKAGQYVQIVIPPYGDIKEHTQRAYSISSVPSDKNHVELLIRLVPNGIVTTYVHNYMKEGDATELVGPFGEFYMRDTNADMVMVAGGSGMAPIKSIIFDMYERNITNRRVWFFFGARSARDLYYVELFRDLEKKWPNFHFVPALSEPKPEDNWSGEVGLITNVLEKYLDSMIPKDNVKEGYLCGSPGMISGCIQVFNKYNIKDVYFDKF